MLPLNGLISVPKRLFKHGPFELDSIHKCLFHRIKTDMYGYAGLLYLYMWYRDRVACVRFTDSEDCIAQMQTHFPSQYVGYVCDQMMDEMIRDRCGFSYVSYLNDQFPFYNGIATSAVYGCKNVFRFVVSRDWINIRPWIKPDNVWQGLPL